MSLLVANVVYIGEAYSAIFITYKLLVRWINYSLFLALRLTFVLFIERSCEIFVLPGIVHPSVFRSEVAVFHSGSSTW